MTIYDIAKEAGVSASSVSRVMNKRTGVNPKTRQKIERLLEKYKFSPNETARGLVNQTSKILGILVTDIRNIHYTDGAYFIEQEMAVLGYCCIIFNTGNSDESQCKMIQILSQRRVEGAIFIGSSFQTEAVKTAINGYLAGVPVVMINGHLDLPNVYGVLADEKQGVFNCVQLMAEKSRRKLAYVMDSQSPSGQLKLQGFLSGVKELADHGLLPPGEKPRVYESPGGLLEGYHATKRILREHPDVDGIIYSVDLIAVGGVRALIDAGVAIPKQVAVIGVDSCLYGEICRPQLTSLDNKLLDSSVAGARILIDCLEGRKATKKIMLFSTITERETT